ncbi:MAG: hypothetical protein V4666_08215 [Bacteroidota bacterium]
METKRIRVLTEVIFNREPFVYVTDKPRPFNIGGKTEMRTITNIVAVDDHYEIYLSSGAEVKHWKNIPKSDRVNIEFYI